MIRITDEDENLIALTISGKISEDDIQDLKSSLDQKTGSGSGPFNAYLDVDDVDGIEFSAIDDVLTSKPDTKFNRVAVVGDGNVEKFASKVAGPFFGGDVKHFSETESASARQWVGG